MAINFEEEGGKALAEDFFVASLRSGTYEVGKPGFYVTEGD